MKSPSFSKRSENNYDIMKKTMQHAFLNYDQAQIIQKLHLKSDDTYIYLSLFGRPYRIHRSDGFAQWSDNGFTDCFDIDYNQAAAIYDLLCYSKADAHPSGRYVTLQHLSTMHSSTYNSGSVIFTQMAPCFDHQEARFAAVCAGLGGVPEQRGDIAFRIPIIGSLSLVLAFWHSDEDFPAVLEPLCDASMLDYMHYESVWFMIIHLAERMQQLLNKTISSV